MPRKGARSGRLLHDLSQLPGEFEVALARHPQDLDKQDIAAGGGPGQTGGHSGLRVVQGRIPEELGRPQIGGDLIRTNHHGLGAALSYLPGRTPAQGGDLPLQVAQPRLPGIGGDEQTDGHRADLQ
jgi:hypothetical protein